MHGLGPRVATRVFLATFLACTLMLSLGVSADSSAPAPAAALVRVDQVGYLARGTKRALLMVSTPIAAPISFTVSSTATGQVVFQGTAGGDLGVWNKAYPAVYPLVFSSVAVPGSYAVSVTSPVSAVSPPFRVGSGAALFAPLVQHAVLFFQAQRDGPDVIPGTLDRQPSHLTDQSAYVYATPAYDSNDVLQGTLTRIGGPVDVSGGWFDAGDYLKFVETASYTDGLMLMVARDAGTRFSGALAEARYGLNWLLKMWNDHTRTLYIQVGIAEGNSSSILGDHDIWRLPQADDALSVKPGDPLYYVKYRPVFEAAFPGAAISPNLAGRVAADFALCAQVYARTDPAFARRCLNLARHVYAQAQTTGVERLVTTYPYDAYPETAWRDDMEWGGAEIALADERLGLPSGRLASDLRTAAVWARAYLSQGHADGDTLNLYDDSAVAHAELVRAMRGAPQRVMMPVTESDLIGDLRTQLQIGEGYAQGDPFGAGLALGQTDAAPHAFGLYVTSVLYRRLSGDRSFDAFGAEQLDWALGANPWGTAFVIGAGTTFPVCPQHQVANLSGSLNGSPPILLGGVVDGPIDPSSLTGLGPMDAMRPCPAGGADPYAAFTGHGAGYVDNVAAWMTVEPADDYTAISLLAFAEAAGS